MTTVAVPKRLQAPATPELLHDSNICLRARTTIAIGDMIYGNDLDQFARGAEAAMDPVRINGLREVDRAAEGVTYLGSSYGQLVAEGLLTFASSNYRYTDEATEVWLNSRERMATMQDIDGGVLKIVLGGMSHVFRRSIAEGNHLSARYRASVGVLSAIYPNSASARGGLSKRNTL